jgi:hypothetical protein
MKIVGKPLSERLLKKCPRTAHTSTEKTEPWRCRCRPIFFSRSVEKTRLSFAQLPRQQDGTAVGCIRTSTSTATDSSVRFAQAGAVLVSRKRPSPLDSAFRHLRIFVTSAYWEASTVITIGIRFLGASQGHCVRFRRRRLLRRLESLRSFGGWRGLTCGMRLIGRTDACRHESPPVWCYRRAPEIL